MPPFPTPESQPPQKQEEEKTKGITPPPAPYLDRDDDELVPDPNNPGELIMKKYLNS